MMRRMSTTLLLSGSMLLGAVSASNGLLYKLQGLKP